MRKILSIYLLTYLAGLSLSAQPVKNITPAANPEAAGVSSSRVSRIDNMIEEYVTNQWLPGAVALIVRDGKVVYHKAFGFSDLEKKTPLKKDDIFRIASQSKAITSLAVMMLWEEGKFMLDEPVSKYVPEFKSPKILKSFNEKDSSYTSEPARGEVTIRQLLTHTSGIDYAVIGSKEFNAIYAKAKVPSGIGYHKGVLGDKMKILGTLPLKHHPGEKWTYGLNNDVLGYLVEVWSKVPFDQFLKTRIFDPMGMKDAYFYLPKDKHTRLVALHEDVGGKAVKMKKGPYDASDASYPTLPGTYFSGGAGLSSTVEDYAKFLQLFLNKGEYNGVRLLSRKTVELMLTPQVPDVISDGGIGLGFGLETEKNDYQSPVSVGSFSWGGAFNTQYWADPKERLIGIIYTNVYSSPHWSIGEKFKALTYQAIAD